MWPSIVSLSTLTSCEKMTATYTLRGRQALVQEALQKLKDHRHRAIYLVFILTCTQVREQCPPVLILHVSRWRSGIQNRNLEWSMHSLSSG